MNASKFLLLLTVIFVFSQLNTGYSRFENTIYEGETKDVEWRPDGQMLAIQGKGGVRIFNREWKLITFFEDITTDYEKLESDGLDPADFPESFTDEVRMTGISWNPDGTEIVAPFLYTLGGFDGHGWKIWELERNDYLNILHSPVVSIIMAIVWNGQGDKIAAASESPYYNGCSCSNISIWSLQENIGAVYSSNMIIGESEAPIYTLAWHPNGQLLASGGADSQINIWDTVSEEIVRTYSEHEGPVNDLAWSGDGEYIASVSDDATIHIWRTLDGTTISVLSEASGAINSLDWNSDGTLLASAGEDAVLYIWEVETGEVIATFEGHEDAIIDLDWSPDDRLIATASLDDTVRIWEFDLP